MPRLRGEPWLLLDAPYKPRAREATPLCRLVQAHYADMQDKWEGRFDGRYGFWRSSTDQAVGAHLDYGILENGFAIYEVDPLLCPRCGGTMRILAFITEPRVIGQILQDLAPRGVDARSPRVVPAEIDAA